VIKQGRRLEHDWYPGALPGNLVLGPDVYVDTAYSFVSFSSTADPGLIMGQASGAYDRTSFIVGDLGRIEIGPFTCLNGTSLICEEAITIGAHCFLAWGSVVTDCWPGPRVSLRARGHAMRAVSANPSRRLQAVDPPRSVVIEDNVWVGFDAVILPGVTLGTGCVVGCKTVIHDDVPPYAVVAGEPPRIIRHLDPVDRDSKVRAC
jgi:acetyltransferase-like isoleucine patch superfamily enzyme